MIPMNYLVPAGNALLLGSFGASVVFALRQEKKLEPTFAKLAIGMLGMVFSGPAIDGIRILSDYLQQDVQKLGDAQALRSLVWQSIKDAGDAPGPGGEKLWFNIPAVVEQLFRTGVWGIASTIADFFFLLAGFFIEVKRDVLLGLYRFLSPLIWGLYPAKPEIGHSIVAYLIEMAFWGPCLYLIQIIVMEVAPKYLNRPGSLGVPIVALEIVATLMILDIPRTVHQMFSGALNPQGETAAVGLIFMASRALKIINKPKGGTL